MKRSALFLAAAVFATAAVVAPAAPARADVSFSDRLGCGVSDAAVTPVFGFQGSGAASNGASYSPATEISAYPGVTGTINGVAGGAQYTTYSPDGYGSQYRGTDALGFPSVVAGKAMTLTIDLPHSQAVEFTVGGIQSPSVIDVAGSLDGTAVTPDTTVRGGGNTSASVVGNSAHVVGGAISGLPDEQDKYAADVWFSSPVDQITLQLSASGSGSDAGFLVTPPVACQSGDVALSSSGVGEPTVADSGEVSYEVPLTATVDNTSESTGAALYPAVTGDLAQAFDEQGVTLNSLTQTSASSQACALAAGADGSGALISSPGALEPGETCALEMLASVSMSQSANDRTVSLSTTLASSTDANHRMKSTSDPLQLVFPGIQSDLSVSAGASARAEPGETLERSTTVTNAGPGAALDTVVSIDYPSGATLSDYPSSCTLNASLECAVGDIAPGDDVEIAYSMTLSESLADGSSLPVTSTATSAGQPEPVSDDYTVTIAVPPVPPGPGAPPPGSSNPGTPPNASAPPGSAPPRSTTPSSPDDSKEADEPPSDDEAPPPSMVSPLADVTALPVSLSLGAANIQPGTVATMRGTLGPNGADESVTVQLGSTINKGMIYRAATLETGGVCMVSTLAFACTIDLEPGESAELTVRVFADALNAPDIARQQITVDSSQESQNNSITVTTNVRSHNEAEEFADSITTFDITEFPGAFLPLLALMLYALAATAVERKRRRVKS
ncbi:DUF11 domain-containing protein [Paramicrobacterium chengjingii]|uniref:DUF11 domain-containing protein n=1 Tax=Paramicrobacterium chengjingii TaxID=2769067 RepID=UPI00142372E3|nr:DUF11 domain-containing protein [Microbacterium chengjingii]